MDQVITLDFETRSPLQLKGPRAVGSYMYSLHPLTAPVCLAWSIDDREEVPVWHPDFPGLPASGERELARMLKRVQGGEIVEAHNVFFEYCIWMNICVPRFGWPELRIEQLRCSAAKAASFALPRSLEDGVAALGLPFPKDMAGRRVMLKVARPRKARVAELRAVGLPGNRAAQAEYEELFGVLWNEKPEELRRVFRYCQQDVRAERALSRSLRDLSPAELAVWRLDFEINWRGVAVDAVGVRRAVGIAGEAKARADAAMSRLTGGAVSDCGKRDAFKAWCLSRGVFIPDTQATTVEEWLKDDTLPEDVARALALWRDAAKSSVAKYRAMAARVAPDGRVRDILRYHAASTGRWAGSGIQPQNFPRGALKYVAKIITRELAFERVGDFATEEEITAAIEAFSGADWDLIADRTVRLAWRWIHEYSLAWLDQLSPKGGLEHLVNSLRGALVPGPGKKLAVADYASIEARVLFWLAGEKRALAVLHGGQNIYKDMSGAILEALGRPCADPQKIPKGCDDYQLGKQAILGLGYQMGGPKFRVTCAGYGIHVEDDFAKQIVSLYRETYPRVPALWRKQERAAIEATRRGPRARQPVVANGIAWAQRGRFLHARLPSGRLLSYCDPRVTVGRTPWGTPVDKLVFMGVDTYTKKWSPQNTYGGKLVENIVQAIARDLMANAMLKCEPSGYTPVLTVHDEIVSEVGADDPRPASDFERLMESLPPWADGLPIAAEGWVGWRYRK